MRLSDFDTGKQTPVMTRADAGDRRGRVEHLNPRRFACHDGEKHVSVAAIVNGPVVRAAAVLTTKLLEAYRPSHFASMQRHAPNYRLTEGSIWTSGRLAFMRAGDRVGRHPDRENMPGTDGVDLILSFGQVGGATLTMYFKDGPPLEVPGDKTIFADFLNEHEV